MANSLDPHEIDNETPGLSMNPEEQKVMDELQGKNKDEGEEVELPSDAPKDTEGKEEENKTYAGKYKTVDDLRKGIDNIGSDLPDYVLEGLSEDALEKHYKELESSIGSKKEEPTAKEDGAKEAIGEDLWAEAESQFNETGGLTTAMYDKLAESGVPSHVVDKYIQSVEAEQQVVAHKIVDMAGGQENFDAMKAWAENGGISDAELDSISNMPYDAMLGALEGVKARYEMANGKLENNTVRITGSTRTGGEGTYSDQSQYILDVGDSRYGRDPKYTAKVDQKFKNSNFS